MIKLLFNELVLTFVIVLIYGRIYSEYHDEYNFRDEVDSYYLSLTTMSTLGYTDFQPKTKRAKMIIMSQQLVLMTGIITILTNILKR